MRKTTIRRVLILFVALLLAVFLLYSLYNTQNEQRTMVSRMQELQQIALPYEKELEGLKLELKELKAQITEEMAPERGRLLVGFQLSTYMDIYNVQMLADEYLFQPVVIIDAGLPEWELVYLLSVAKTMDYEVVFTASPVTRESLKAVASIRQSMADTSLIDTGAFLIRGVDDTEENLDLLAKNGYKRCFRVINNYASETLDNGLTCLGFGYLNSRNISMKSNLQNAADNKLSYMYVFDFSTWTMAQSDEKVMSGYFDTINTFTGDGSLLASTVEESFESMKAFNILKAEQEAANELSVKKLEEEIEKLELVIRQIYAEGDTIMD